MRRYIYFLIVFISILSRCSFAQSSEAVRWHVAAGVAFPAGPDQFYYYWKQGFQVMGGAEFPTQMRFIQFISAELNYFAFDQQRFLKRIGIENSNTSISGAATYVLSLEYLIRYPFTEYQSFRPTFFVGLGCSDIFRSSATIEYPNYSVTQGSNNSIVATVPFGASVIVHESGNKTVEVTFTYIIGLSQKQNINSNFTSAKIDYLFSQ